MFIGELSFNFKILANAFDDLDIEIVQRGSARNEVLGNFLIA